MEAEAEELLRQKRQQAALDVPFDQFVAAERLRMQGGFKADPSIEQLV